MAFRALADLLDFIFIKFIEIGFTFSIAFLSSRIIGASPRSGGRESRERPATRFAGKFAIGIIAKFPRDVAGDL